jgi:SAM-dependent methyltransferase
MNLDRDARAERKARTQALLDAATEQFSRGVISRADWQQQVSGALASAYLEDDDPRWQAGFDGDAALWREARSLVLLAAPMRGSFLDVGCANGHLLESFESWAAERGQCLELYGLELNPDLADVARRRLPHLAARIFTGNVSDWVPPRRFDCVRTGLEYVPPGEELALLRHIAFDIVDDTGRLLVGPINDEDLAITRELFTRAGLILSQVVSRTDHRGKVRHVVWSEVASIRR